MTLSVFAASVIDNSRSVRQQFWCDEASLEEAFGVYIGVMMGLEWHNAHLVQAKPDQSHRWKPEAVPLGNLAH